MYLIEIGNEAPFVNKELCNDIYALSRHKTYVAVRGRFLFFKLEFHNVYLYFTSIIFTGYKNQQKGITWCRVNVSRNVPKK